MGGFGGFGVVVGGFGVVVDGFGSFLLLVCTRKDSCDRREKIFYLKRKDRWQRSDRWQTVQDSFHFDETIAGNKIVRSLHRQRSLRSYGNQALLS